MNRNDFGIFLSAFAADDPLEELYRESIKQHVPVLRPDSRLFLVTLLSAVRPAAVLEIGSGIGYSAMTMALACPDASVTTIELDAERAALASAHFAEAGGRIRLLEGDAGQILPSLEGPYDLVFLDGPKGQYPVYFPEIHRLLKEGGVLLADNILLDGTLPESRFAVPRGDRTIHERMRGFLETLMRHPAYHSSLLQTGDGLLLAVKKVNDHA